MRTLITADRAEPSSYLCVREGVAYRRRLVRLIETAVRETVLGEKNVICCSAERASRRYAGLASDCMTVEYDTRRRCGENHAAAEGGGFD